MKILFVTWDGPQVSYLESLFVPIFAGLREHGHEFAVLQFTWGADVGARAACDAVGIPYRRVEIWRTGAAGAFLTALFGGRHVDRAVRDWRVEALMPRALLPALAVLRSKTAKKLPIIFDADGLPADERVEFAGLNPHGPVYRVLRQIEAAAVRRAQTVLVRTEAAIPILMERAGSGVPAGKFHIVTNGRDPAPFLAAKIPANRKPGPKLCYIGSIGPQYQPERMFELAAQIRSSFPTATFSVFTREREAAANAMASAGLPNEDWITIETLAPDTVPRALAGCDIGFALRQPSFSMQAVAPVKIGDYLLAGVPIIGTEGVGPVGEAIASGCMLPSDRPLDEITEWVGDILAKRAACRDRCRKLGLAEFSLARSIEQYREALR